jgi:non-ribosomal peptide synthetase component E (peptide arylation enzyme)
MTTLADTHLMLVSDQAAPNLLPALDPAMKPKEAVLLVSQKMATRALALQAVLTEVGIKTHTVPLTLLRSAAICSTTIGWTAVRAPRA